MPNILLVEDNPSNAKLASLVLRKAGYDIVVAVDASEAEGHLAERSFDLILMDLGLPGKDGYQLTREIRINPRTQAIPVVAITSFAMKGDQEKAKEAGCSGYLAKPIDRAELLRVVHSLLEPARPSATTP
jgi:CheY-like chemotaxis protein